MNNPEKIEIEGLRTIHKLCKFGADHNMEGCSFTEIVERMFAELAKPQAVPEEIEIGRLQDRITELLDERQELYAQLNTGTTKGFALVQKDLIQSIHQSCVNSLIAESMPAFKAVANTIIYELSPMVKAIQAEAQEQSHESN